jgi:hypothetical protein
MWADTADLSSGAAAGGCYWSWLPNRQLVSASLMVVHIAKFFYWEKWYLHAADIQVSVLLKINSLPTIHPGVPGRHPQCPR